MEISREKFSSMIAAAFEEGWYGSIENKTDYTDRITSMFDIDFISLAELRKQVVYKEVDIVHEKFNPDEVLRGKNFIACNGKFLPFLGINYTIAGLKDNSLIGTIATDEKSPSIAIFYMLESGIIPTLIVGNMPGYAPNKIDKDSVVAFKLICEPRLQPGEIMDSIFRD